MTPAQITKQYGHLRARAKKTGQSMPFTLAEYRAWYVAQFPDTAACAYCRVRLTTAKPEPDHIIPLARGGSSELDNLILACHRCNVCKGELTGEEWTALLELMDRWPIPAQKYVDKKLYARPIYRR